MPLIIDPSRPIYLQIMEELKRRTARGEYRPGGRIPSVRSLAGEMSVNPNTVARVFIELEREGFIETRRGQGSFITDDIRTIDRERRILIESAADSFIHDIGSLALDEDLKHMIIEMIREKLTESPKKYETTP